MLLGVLPWPCFGLGATEVGSELGVDVFDMFMWHFICVRGCSEHFTPVDSGNPANSFTDEEAEAERGSV